MYGVLSPSDLEDLREDLVQPIWGFRSDAGEHDPTSLLSEHSLGV